MSRSHSFFKKGSSNQKDPRNVSNVDAVLRKAEENLLSLETLANMADSLIELDFIIFSTISFLKELDESIIDVGDFQIMNNCWNYLDSAMGLIIAASLLADKKTHTQTENAVKATLLASSSIQLITCSILDAAAFGQPAMVAAAALDLAMATFDMLKAYKKTTQEGWLEDAEKEKAFVKKKIADLEAQQPANSKYYERISAPQYEAERVAYSKTLHEIEELKTRLDGIESNIRAYNNGDLKLRAQAQKEFNEKAVTCALKLITFAAVVVSFAMCPPALVPLVLIAIGVAGALIKNGIKIKEKLDARSEALPKPGFAH